MDRRRFLQLTGTISCTAVAGCSGSDTTDNEGSSAQTTAEPTTQATTETPTTYPEPETVSFEGTGDTATESFTPDTAGPTALAASHRGSGNFATWILNADGERVDLMANAIGDFDGVRLYDLPQSEHYLNIEASGSWGVEARMLPLYEAGESIPTSDGRDFGSIMGPINFQQGTRVTFSTNADGNNAVWLKNKYGADVDLLFNEIDAVSDLSTIISTSGVGYLEIESNGAWEVSLESA